jgi:DNA-binding CsgD family transcriptional regulator
MADYGLTPREAELVALIAAGASNKEIASQLGLSGNTVRNHIHNVFEKTGARNRVELVRKLYY